MKVIIRRLKSIIFATMSFGGGEPSTHAPVLYNIIIHDSYRILLLCYNNWVSITTAQKYLT